MTAAVITVAKASHCHRCPDAPTAPADLPPSAGPTPDAAASLPERCGSVAVITVSVPQRSGRSWPECGSRARALAGKFAPTPEMFTLANHSSQLMTELFDLIRDVLRPDVVLHDLSLVFELVAAIKGSTPERTSQLRHRYLALILDGRCARQREDLPGPPPSWTELSERRIPAGNHAQPHRPTRAPSLKTPS